MAVELMECLKDVKSVSIIGSCKNAGKTTVLNKILEEFRGTQRVGLTSIGYDGEESDLLTGTHKPRIYVSAGTIVATARGLVQHCDFSREVIGCTDHQTSLGEVVILRAKSDGFAQVAGPAISKSLTGLCAQLKKFGCSRILVDGALDRRASASPGITDGCILATGACISHDMDKVIRETVHITRLLSLPEFDNPGLTRRFHSVMGHSDVGILKADKTVVLVKDALSEESPSEVAQNLCGAEVIFVKGVLTGRFLEGVLRLCNKLSGIRFVVEDGTRLFINEKHYEELLSRDGSIEVLKKINLLCVAVNPVSPYGYSFDGEMFREGLMKHLKLPVLNVMGGVSH